MDFDEKIDKANELLASAYCEAIECAQKVHKYCLARNRNCCGCPFHKEYTSFGYLLFERCALKESNPAKWKV